MLTQMAAMWEKTKAKRANNELKGDEDYSDKSQGFLDDNGHQVNPNQRPELPDSISQYGQPLHPNHSVSK